jgi:type II protein arginine methyltransferase
LIDKRSQEPVYLPSDSELEVSIWRLTNQRQVWYEWYAEVFLPIGPSAPPPSVFSFSSPPKKPAGLAFVFPAPAIPAAPPSPLIDAIDSPMMDLGKGSPGVREDRPDAAESEIIVKIAQTALHNPGGRSSWIGL